MLMMRFRESIRRLLQFGTIKGLSLYLNDIKDKISSKEVASTILAACSDINTQGGWKGDRYGSAFLIELEKTLSA